MSRRTRRFAAGAGWLFGYRWLERLLELGALVVLGRLLTPDDFGLVAIAASIIAIIEGLAAFDVQKALIRSRDEDRDLFDTAWTLALLRGLLAALVMVGIALVLESPRLSAVILALAVSPLLAGAANPRFVLFERRLRYSKLAVLTLGAKVLSVGITVALALAYRSFWALVVGMVVGAAATSALSYALRPYRPRLSLGRVREIFGFSGWLSLTSLVTAISLETDKLIVGRVLGIADAGLYTMTQRIGVLPTRELVSPLQRILFPSFSELAEDLPRLRRVVAESINGVAALSLPAGFGFALMAADFVPLALGPQWLGIVPLLTVLVPYLGVRATLSMALPCVMALGRLRLLFGVSLAYALVHLPVFIAATVRWGLLGAIWGLVAAGVLYWALNAWMLHRTLGLTLGEILRELRRPLVAALVMAAAVGTWGGWGAEEPPGAAGPWISLALKVGLGALVYGGCLYGLGRLEGRPAGFEGRLAQLLVSSRGASGERR